MFFEDPEESIPELDGTVEHLTELVSAVLRQDPVMTTNLQQIAISKVRILFSIENSLLWCGAQLNEFQQLLPEETFQQLLASIDERLRDFLTGTNWTWQNAWRSDHVLFDIVVFECC